MPTRAVGIVAGVGALLLPAPVAAQSATATSPSQTAPSVEQGAREAFRAGVALASDGHWSLALAAFLESRALRAHPVTTYNVAYCERALGRLTRARKGFRDALGEHAAGNAGVLGPDLLEQARSYLAEANATLVRALILANKPDFSVVVDGVGLDVEGTADPAAEFYVAGTNQHTQPTRITKRRFTLLLDPGAHVVVVSRPGIGSITTRWELEPRGTPTLPLPEPHAQAQASVLRVEAMRKPSYTPAIVVWTASAVALAEGVVFGVATLQKRASLVSSCGASFKTCPEAQRGGLAAAERDATLSTVGFVTAGVGAAVGGMLFWSAKPPARESRVSARIGGGQRFVGLELAGEL